MVSEKFRSTRVIYNKSGSYCNFPYSRFEFVELNCNVYFTCFWPQTHFRANLIQKLKTVELYYVSV